MRAQGTGYAGAEEYLAAVVLEVREQHGAVTVVLRLSPRGGLGPLHVSHYELSCALGRLQMADGGGNAVRISDPVVTEGASLAMPGHIRVPSEGLALAVQLLDNRQVATATNVRGVAVPPADGAALTYSLDATVRAASAQLDRYFGVRVRGTGTLTYRRGR
jgi:hypothetical protein